MNTAYQFVTDIWRFYREFAPKANNTDEFWKRALKAAEELESKYGKNNKHMHVIILDVIDALREEAQDDNQ